MRVKSSRVPRPGKRLAQEPILVHCTLTSKRLIKVYWLALYYRQALTSVTMSEKASSYRDTPLSSDVSNLQSINRCEGVEKDASGNRSHPKSNAAVTLPRQPSSGSDAMDSLPASPRTSRRRRRRHIMPVGSIEMPERRPSLIPAASIDFTDYMPLSPLPDPHAVTNSLHLLSHPRMKPQLSRTPSITVNDYYTAVPSASERGSQKLQELYENITIAIRKKSKPKAQPQKSGGPLKQVQELTQSAPSSMDQLWNELQAYLCERKIEEQYQLLHSSRERIEQILLEVVQFKLEEPPDNQDEYSQCTLSLQCVSLQSVKEEESGIGMNEDGGSRGERGGSGGSRGGGGWGAEEGGKLESEKLSSSSKHTFARSGEFVLFVQEKHVEVSTSISFKSSGAAVHEA